MAEVKGWSALMKAVQKKIDTVQKNEVFETVRDVYQEHIQSDVYDVYSPSTYIRRMGNGGLIDDNNIVGEVKNCVLEVKDIAVPNDSISQPQTPYDPSNDTQFASWIENGEVYNGKAKYLFRGDKSGEPWANPRPFTQNTIDDLKQNKQHVKALKEGLRKRGIKTE